MRIAAIDIGTNSLHMIVVKVRPDLSFEVIDREKEMVRLGVGGLDGYRGAWDYGAGRVGDNSDGISGGGGLAERGRDAREGA